MHIKFCVIMNNKGKIILILKGESTAYLLLHQSIATYNFRGGEGAYISKAGENSVVYPRFFYILAKSFYTNIISFIYSLNRPKEL